MKNIHLISQEPFVEYKSKIGVILDDTNQNAIDIFVNGKHLVVKRDELSTPSNNAVEKELTRNDELKEMAYENNLIELHSQDADSYLAYATYYN
jgi:hypothetical protein